MQRAGVGALLPNGGRSRLPYGSYGLKHPRILRPVLALGVAAVLAATPQSATAQTAQRRHGDVSGDGQVTALDAQAILSAVVGLPLPPSFVLSNGVANCDGRTTPAALDAQIVLSFVIGLGTAQFCVGQTFGPGATTISVVLGTPPISVADTSLLVNRKLQIRAVLRDDQGNPILRPVTWQTSNADLVAIDSARGDTAWVGNHFTTTGAADASATITAHADGTLSSMQIRVFRDYRGIVIVPQRGDTLRQLNGVTSFQARSRDSLGVLGTFPRVFWTIGDVTIASVPAAANNTGTVTALTTGSTYLYAALETNTAVRDSVRITVALPPLNVCTGSGGTLHSSQSFTTPQVWSPATNPHYVNGTLNFNAGSSLLIQPGTLVCVSSGAFLAFHAGSRLDAQGTVTQPIAFRTTQPTDFWSGIQLGDFTSAGPAPDTSVIRNATFERISNGNGGIDARERHVLTMDSVTVRQSNVNAVTLMAAGSLMLRSRVDTILSANQFQYAVTLGRGALEETTVRVGNGITTGVQILEAATLRQVTIVGGGIAVDQNTSADSARINGVSITGASAIALDLDGGLLHPASANVTVAGTGGGFRGQIGNFGTLFPDSVSQATLKGIGRDTVFITGGALVGKTVVVRPDLPWVVSTQTTIDTLGVLVPRPGSALRFSSAGLVFQRGGTLDARGEAAKVISFAPLDNSSANFFGLQFNNPGAAANPVNNPTAVSTLAFVRIDSTSGQGTPGGGICHNSCVAGIISGDRHRVLVDNAVIRRSASGAIYLNTPGSQITNSTIDTTGTIGTNFTTNTAAVALGEQTLLQNVVVRRSGHVGVYVQASPATDTAARLQNVRIVASQNIGLDASAGVIAGDHGSVRVDSANGASYRGTIQNLAALARDSVTQLRFRGNVDDVAIITGGALRGTDGVHTPAAPLVLEAIPGLRWQIEGSPTIDTLAQLRPRAGSDFAFVHTSFTFSRGGTLNAAGEAGKVITFRPLNGNFHGLQFNSPGAAPNPVNNPTATSTLTFVRVDSASGVGTPSGGVCHNSCSAAVNAGDRHRLLISNARVHKAWSGAIYMNTPGSQIVSSTVDTTGTPANNFTSNTAALALGERTLVQSTVVHRSGGVGIYAVASPATDTSARLQNVRIVASRGIGLQADLGVLAGDLGSVRIDSANVVPFQGSIQNFATIARDSVSQLLLRGNESDVAIISAGTLRGIAGTHTIAAPLVVDAIPGLPWQVHGATVIDSLARLRARPAADFAFVNGNMSFQAGGTLEAIGEVGKIITFHPLAGSNANFNGLQFQNVGSTPNPLDNLVAESRLTYVRIDSASGVGTPSGGICHNSCSSAINAADRHRLLIDNARIHRAWNGAVYMNTPGSTLANSLVDTTGNIGSGYTNNTAAVALGERVVAQNTLVHRSGHIGVYSVASPATDTAARLQNVRIVGSRNIGLQADQGVLAGDLGSVRIDSANVWPFQGTIQNFAILARDSVSQRNFLGNENDLAIITAGTLRGTPSQHTQEAPLTVEAIPGLRWQVHGQAIIDSLARLSARPAADFTFVNGSLSFQGGGVLSAIGESGKTIRFRPVPGSNANFNGIQFQNPGANVNPALSLTVASTLQYVQLDSASGVSTPTGGICHNSCSAAINTGDRHRVTMDNARIHRAWNGAVYLAAPLSGISNSLIDTTGNVASGYTNNTAAIALNDTTSLQNVTVHRSGHTGVYVDGDNILMSGVRVSRSAVIGIEIGNNAPTSGSNGLSLSGFVVDSTTGVGVSIGVSNLTLTGCDVLRSSSHGFALTSSFTGVQIHDCNIGGAAIPNEANLGQGVFNPATNPNFVDAVDNWWGIDPNTGGNLIPTNGGVNGYSGNVTISPQRPTKRVP